ncbi:MAG: 2-oxoglutarate and iron-dependent oxygenase domain-containing protein [Pseudomonadota bacterium]
MNTKISEIPIIDLSETSGSADITELATFLGQVFHQVGFAVVTNHGIPQAVTDAAFSHARAFFELPSKDRASIDKRRSRHFRGWECEGSEYTNNRPDIREQLDFWTPHQPRPRDVEPHYLRLLGPNQWPDESIVPGFRPAIESWIEGVRQLADLLLRLLSISLRLPPDHLGRAFGEECMSLCKVIKYPPTPPGQFGVNAHHDAGFLTVLATDGNPGLEIQDAAGDWVPVPNVPGGLIVNLGEVLQKMTGNYFVATPHRVLTAGKRQSLAYFHGPSLDMPLLQLPLEPCFAEAVAASPRHANAGFMIQIDEAEAGAADMSSPAHPDVYGDQLWNYFKRSYPENVALHYGAER